MRIFRTPIRALTVNLQVMVGLALTAFLIAGCGDSGLTAPEELTFAPELGVNLAQMTRSSAGLYHLDEVVGSGEVAKFGHRVTVEYEGWLHNGKLFDTSETNGPFTFGPLGNGEVIAGWNMGVQGMRVGGTRLLVVPPTLGYGGGGRGALIPGNSTLVFRITLVSVTPWVY